MAKYGNVKNQRCIRLQFYNYLTELIFLHSRGEKKRRSKSQKIDGEQKTKFRKKDLKKYRCFSCDYLVQNNETSMNDHYTGKSHLRLKELHLYTAFFEDLGLFSDLSKKCYNYKKCGHEGI